MSANTELIKLIDKALPQLHGAERDDLAAQIAAFIAANYIPKARRGRK